MWKKVLDYIVEYQMLQPGGRVLAALSGGADSVCLLSVLKQISDEPGGFLLAIKAVHVHHGLRGGEADRDVRFVKELCEHLNVPLTVLYRDVAGYAREHGNSLEEAGRLLRYEALQAEAAGWGAAKIAVAHHQDDNGETILHHLVRGSGLKGLAGMPPVRENLIRPLLGVSRQEILGELAKKNLSWVEDSTNADLDYTRNRIRNQILPLLTEHINARAVENILHAGALAGQADVYLQKTAASLWEQSGHLAPEPVISLNVLKAQDPLIRSYLFRRMMELTDSRLQDVTTRHYEGLEELLWRRVGSRMDLPGGLVAVREYEDFRIVRKKTGPAAKKMLLTAENVIMETFLRKKEQKIPENQYTKWFDYDKIEGALSVRTRQPGDYISLPGGGKKPVNRYFIDRKVPAAQREEILLLAEGNHVLWIVGYRISEYYKITEDTKTILQVTVNGGKNYGR